MLVILFILMFGLLVLMSYYDFKTMRIPLYLNLTMLAVSVLYRIITGYEWIFIISGTIGLVFFIIIRKITHNGLGLGDAVLSASIGVLLGFRLWFAAVAFSCITALFYIVIYSKIKNKNIRKTRIPFAPFLSLRAIILLFFQIDILSI